jgi:hypothetical protein
MSATRYESTTDKLFGDEIIRLMVENNALLNQCVRILKENNEIFKQNQDAIFNLQENVRKIRFNTQ